MADIVRPEGKYTVQTVGPSRPVSFKGQNGEDVNMTNYDIQLEGDQNWVSLMQKTDSPAPKQGDTLEGHVEDAGKYGLKFKKKRGGGNWPGGGNQASPGAIWSATFQTAAQIAGSYLAYAPEDKRPKDIDDYLARIEVVAVKLRALVDKHAGETTQAVTETKPAPPPSDANNNVDIEDISDKELGPW